MSKEVNEQYFYRYLQISTDNNLNKRKKLHQNLKEINVTGKSKYSAKMLLGIAYSNYTEGTI